MRRSELGSELGVAGASLKFIKLFTPVNYQLFYRDVDATH
jgi:hypothetical protein